MGKRLTLLALFACCLLAGPASAETWRIGVLAHRGYDATLQRWEPTAAYLGTKLPHHHFEVVPLDLPQVEKATAGKEIDFLLTNTGNYVEMEVFHGVSRIATVKNSLDGKVFTRFGAVIFTRADRSDINELADLKGKTFMGVEEDGFGGFRMAWRELKAAGIDPYKHFRGMKFSGFPQDEVAFAVRDGIVDAGTLRADVLLSLELDKKIDSAQLKILNRQQYPDYPAISSTRLYPTWPFAKLSHTPADLAEQVSAALIQMPTDASAAAAAGIAGWTVPLDYQSVHELLIELKVGPYEHLRHIEWSAVVEQYWMWIAALLALTVVLAGVTAGMSRANRKLHVAETELRKHRDRLSEMIQEATIDVVRARDEALQASEAKSRFLANVSHELRTPLNAIIGYSSIVREVAAEQGLTDCSRDLDNVIGASTNLLGQIDDLLDVTMLETGTLQLSPESVAVEQLISELAETEKAKVSKKGNTLKCVVNPMTGSMVVDKARLRQILSALLTNAGKFTENGTITIEVTNERRLQREFVCFRVRDNGAGMSENEQARLFERFCDVDSAAAKIKQGLGLGLYKTRTLCEKMGGEISVRSELGYGTEICVRLPRGMEMSSTPSAATEPAAAADAPA